MTKKIFAVLLCLVMVIGCLAGCNKNEQNPTNPTDGTTSTNPTDATTPGNTETPKLSSTLNLSTDVSKYVTLGEYKGVEYVVNKWSVTDEDVQKQLETAFPEYPKITEGTTKDGDNVNISFIGYVDGKEDPNCTYDDEGGYSLTLGSGAMIDGFESGIVGKEIGKEFELKLKFPNDYHEDYKGKDVTFKITVNYVTGAVVYPEVTDALVKEKTNDQYKTVAEYKEYLKKSLEESAKEDADVKNVTNVMDAIIKNATFKELPQEEIAFYNSYVLSQNQSYANMFGMTLDEWLSTMMGTSVEKFEEYNKEAAETYVKNKLVLIAICQAENKDMTDEDFDKRLTEDMEAYGYSALADFKKAIEDNDSLVNWRTSYVLNDLEDWLVENATPVEKAAEESTTTTTPTN